MSMTSSNSSNDKNVRLRHACAPRRLIEVNNNLKDAQRTKIEATPFRVVNMLVSLKIYGLLLWELDSRWDEHTGGFRVRGRVVPFTPVDVSFAVGLPIVGERVRVDENVVCHTLSLFEGGDVTIQRIVDLFHVFENDEVNFCRLYIFLAFGEFYFTRSGRQVYTGMIKLLDDLESLNNYNWGLAVSDFLVDSLSKVAHVMKEGKKSKPSTHNWMRSYLVGIYFCWGKP